MDANEKNFCTIILFIVSVQHLLIELYSPPELGAGGQISNTL